MAGIFNASIFNNAIFNTGDQVAAAAEVGGGVGGVANWPGHQRRGWDKWWKKEHAKKLKALKEAAEKKIEGLQKQVRKARDDLQEARALEAIQALTLELERIQKLLNEEQAILDDLEMQEVAMIWALWKKDR